ncbi:MAG: HypC/HybG/HupF family hydrogenase formation chaperone [Clostridia bacterium]|nr:HypC/HybG/HupF family hydrogenase formation chaperone [Clostridia bacterium]
MCLAVPSKVIELKGEYAAEIEYLGNRRDVSITLVPDVKQGDWVLVHAGFALEIIDEQYAAESLKLWREMNDELAIT